VSVNARLESQIFRSCGLLCLIVLIVHAKMTGHAASCGRFRDLP